MDAVMAEDEEVEAAEVEEDVARILVDAGMRQTDALVTAMRVIRHLDRVCSRPAGSTTGGTESEDHEAGIEMATQVIFGPPTSASARQLVGEAIAAYRECVPAPSPVSGTEPENSGQRGMRDYLAMKRRPSMEVSGTEPDTDGAGRRRYPTMLHGDAATAARHAEHGGTEPDMAKLVEAVERVLVADDDRHYLPRQLRQGLTDAFDALAGFFVDAGKPEEER